MSESLSKRRRLRNVAPRVQRSVKIARAVNKAFGVSTPGLARSYARDYVYQRSGAAAGRRRRGEVKSVDYPNAATGTSQMVFSQTAVLTLLNGTLSGAGAWNRIGRKINMKSVHIRGGILKINGASIGYEYLRLMLIYDAQPNANPIAAIGDVLADYDRNGVVYSNCMSGLNLANVDRFRIIRDKRVEIPMDIPGFANGAVFESLSPSDLEINWFVKLKNLETHYNANTTGAIGDIVTGALYLIAYGYNALGGGSPPTSPNWAVNFQARLKFVDA